MIFNNYVDLIIEDMINNIERQSDGHTVWYDIINNSS